jgi:hypothetical protein
MSQQEKGKRKRSKAFQNMKHRPHSQRKKRWIRPTTSAADK